MIRLLLLALMSPQMALALDAEIPLKAGSAAARESMRKAREDEADAILADMHNHYGSVIETVHVGAEEITLIGKAAAPMQLIGIPPESASHNTSREGVVAKVEPDTRGVFRLNLPRVEPSSSRDRAVWRWRLCDEAGHWTSAARWATAYGSAVGRKLPRLSAPHQKGIGVPPIAQANHEIFDLGIRHATMNVLVHHLISDKPAPGWTPWPFEGRTYYLHEKQLQSHDTTLRHLAAHHVIVSAILLVTNERQADGAPRSLMTHPEAQAQGVYAMPNLTSEASARLYCAVLHHLAERWTREDGSCGRVSNWIMHNEIDQGATWTNMGEQPLTRYLEAYLRSVRLMHHTARLFDPHARVFISLTHHWAKKSSGSGTYVVRDIVELFAEMARAEGDFEWGVAYHPYPQDLRNPDAWNDADVTDDFDTPLITPKNIQVLPAFLNQSRFLFQGKPRGILLSEQGFNTPTLSIHDQSRQVAGLIYMFRRIRPLQAIEAFHLHRYHDMPEQEGGLRLGIITETGTHKLGWDAYKAVGTDHEAEFAKIADEVICATQARQ